MLYNILALFSQRSLCSDSACSEKWGLKSKIKMLAAKVQRCSGFCHKTATPRLISLYLQTCRPKQCPKPETLSLGKEKNIGRAILTLVTEDPRFLKISDRRREAMFMLRNICQANTMRLVFVFRLSSLFLRVHLWLIY